MDQVIEKIRDASTPCRDADFLPNVLGEHYQEAAAGRIRVVLFGAGSAGSHLCDALKGHGVGISCFCDNNPEIIGGSCAGHPVISAKELKRDYPESMVILSVSPPYDRQIKDQLLHLGFPPARIHAPSRESLLFYTNAASLHWSPADLEAYGTEIETACDVFADGKSKDLFVQRTALLTNGLDYRAFHQFIDGFADLVHDPDPHLFSNPRYDENYFYFNTDFFPLNQNEVFANVGALVGDCALEFAKSCREQGVVYRQIINFEPDPDNFRQLSENMNRLANVKCLPYGLWSERSRLKFANPDQGRAGTPGSLSNDGNMEVDVASLDELLPDSDISFIKMDVEGAEMEALRGAANTIRRKRPKMAISVYHKREDVFEIPLFIHHLYPGYRLYLRHHSTTFGETVLFAVP